ncbi:pyridoxal 5-phosphate dependent beta-lyase [Sinosporangium album]|uniref:Pyridoxal 5-phosphate dependent beta-lyase n=1 Tax=Sinosporangium album TaxID=504805 RepID=A0A1G7R1R2_9ACTN|nr:aminotransferase class V-fold PLP-dependent enzyme [Sinosporangium album]SDG04685.1 pyridoxal 5-phosphate dependent beta-lyase [Sinosporangium album]
MDTAATMSTAAATPSAGDVARVWRAARGAHPQGHLDAAGCGVPSDRVLDAMVAHLHREREVGGYAAVPDMATPKAALAALVDARAQDVAFAESGTAAMAALLADWPLPAGARVGVTRAEYGPTVALLRRLAVRHRWTLVDVPLGDWSRLDLSGLGGVLAAGLDLLVLSHIGSHRGVVQPAAGAAAMCRAAGVPLVLDVCQSAGHVDTRGVGAAAYVGTSRKWLAGPRGAGFSILPPSEPGGALRPAADYESYEGPIAARVGLGVAVLEHHALGPGAVHARLAALGGEARRILHGVGGWEVLEPLDEPSALVTLRPPAGSTAESAAASAAAAGLAVAVVPPARAPGDMTVSLLRVSPSPGASEKVFHRLAGVLATR